MEVLTDRPEDRFVVGTVLHREGDDRPLTIATAEAVADGPGLAHPVPRGDDARRRRRPPRRLPRVGRPARRGPRPRLVLLARGHRLRGARHRWRRARDGQGHLPDRRDRGLHRRRRAVRLVRPACRARVHPHLRAASRRDRRRRRVARPAAAAIARARSRPPEGAAAPDAGAEPRAGRRPTPRRDAPAPDA